MTREEAKDYIREWCPYDRQDEIIKALEQKPKSEWQQDHKILKAYSDGASAVLDKIRAEIIELRSRQNVGVMECLDIIDKYAEEDKA